MELDLKIRYAMLALTAVSLVLAGIGVHGAMHGAAHLKALEIGGGAD